MSEEQPPSKANEEQQALAAFNHAAEELRFFKGQQWHVANYALLAYAAVVATQRVVENPFMTRFAEVLVVAVLLVGRAPAPPPADLSTPLGVVQAYVEALQAGDVTQHAGDVLDDLRGRFGPERNHEN